MGKYDVGIPAEMLSIIDNCTVGLGAAGLVGGVVGPGADLIVIVPVWMGMTLKLADQAGQTMSEQTAKRIAMAVCSGAGFLIGGTKIASAVLGWVGAAFTFGLSLAASAAANAALNASFTRAYGKSIARLFLKTTEISDSETVVHVLIALMGAEVNINTPYDHLIS